MLQSVLYTLTTVDNEMKRILNVLLPSAVPAQESTGPMPFSIMKHGKTANTCKFHHLVSDIYCLL